MKFAQEVGDISVKFLIGLLLLEHWEKRIQCVGLNLSGTFLFDFYKGFKGGNEPPTCILLGITNPEYC